VLLLLLVSITDRVSSLELATNRADPFRYKAERLVKSLEVAGRPPSPATPKGAAIGSDLDGFVKPTLGDVESDLATFAEALRARHSQSAEGILTGNALRVIERRFV
jgi:hypothetical protein